MSFLDTKEAWDNHYRRERSRQTYPDETLVRLLKTVLKNNPSLTDQILMDYGCGSGRHIPLYEDLGFSIIRGTDMSTQSVELCRTLYPDHTFTTIEKESGVDEVHIPLEDSSAGVVVLWGVLHYNSTGMRKSILKEIQRILVPGGFLLGTLRSHRDTHLVQNEDIRGTDYHTFDEKETKDMLGEYFQDLKLGHMERSLLDHLDQILAHWFFMAEKKL